MIKCFERTVAANSPFAIQKPQMLLRFGIDREPGLTGYFVLRDELGDAFKLAVSVWMFAARDVFANLASTDSRVVEPLSDRVSAHGGSHLRQTLRQILRGQVGVNDVLFIGVSSGTELDAFNQVGFFRRFGIDLFFRPAPGRRTRPAAGSSCR